MIASRTAALFVAFAVSITAQQSQNPSPMVEHTRAHPRVKEETPPGRRASRNRFWCR